MLLVLQGTAMEDVLKRHFQGLTSGVETRDTCCEDKECVGIAHRYHLY